MRQPTAKSPSTPNAASIANETQLCRAIADLGRTPPSRSSTSGLRLCTARPEPCDACTSRDVDLRRPLPCSALATASPASLQTAIAVKRVRCQTTWSTSGFDGSTVTTHPLRSCLLPTMPTQFEQAALMLGMGLQFTLLTAVNMADVHINVFGSFSGVGRSEGSVSVRRLISHLAGCCCCCWMPLSCASGCGRPCPVPLPDAASMEGCAHWTVFRLPRLEALPSLRHIDVPRAHGLFPNNSQE